MACGLSVFTLNVNGLCAKLRRKRVYNFLKQNRYDIIFLQETGITDNVSAEWEREWKNGFIYHENTSRSMGQIILFSERCSNDITIISSSKRFLAVKLTVCNKPTVVINIYAPNGDIDKENFFDEILNKIKDIDCDNIILGGDFNCVLDNNKDIITGQGHKPETVRKFNDLIDRCDLYDTWRLFNPETKEYTWSRHQRQDVVSRRLDYLFVSNEVLNHVTESNIVSVPFSDHRGCVIKIKENEIVRGKGFWKFNNALLNDNEYVTSTKAFINNYTGEEVDDQLNFEMLKIKIKELTISYCQNKNKYKKLERQLLYTELNNLDKYISERPYDTQAKEKRDRLKIKLDIFEVNETKAAQVRSRVKFTENWERNTKLFLGLEKARANAKVMEQVKDEHGNILTSQKEIQSRQKDYFQNLYKKRVHEEEMENKIEEFMHDCNVPRLLENERESLETQITENEILLALKEMNNGSAPGCDGLTIEFIKFFWIDLKNHILKSFMSSLNKGTLSISQRSAVITLIHKGKELPREEMKNWRPISLTNSDYKLLAKCLALRMNTVIHSLIKPDQVGYVKGRQSSTHLRLIDDVIDQMNKNNKPGLLATIDMFHAFDCISKEFMIKTFKKFGFGPNFISWVNLLMKETRSCINYAGWLSGYFQAESGIRQGCPFSPMAFVLALELLAIKIRQSKDVKGLALDTNFNINNFAEALKIALYADDITLFLSDEHDLTNALSIFRAFRGVSGLEINISKCEAMWLGSNKNRRDIHHNFNWKNKIKILGIYFSTNKLASDIEENYLNRITAIKRLIAAWEKRDLSIMGKVLIAKTFLISQLVYYMQAFTIPENVITQINRLLYRFIWKKRTNNKKAFEKIKRNVICADYEDGGIKMIDLRVMQTSFLLQWVPRLFLSDASMYWKNIAKSILSSHGPNFECFHANVSAKRLKGYEQIRSNFWQSVLKSFLDNNNRFQNKEFNPMLWNNINFTYNGNVLFFKEWAQKGLIRIQDLIDNNDCIPLERIRHILGNSPQRFLEYATVRSVVVSFLKKRQNYENCINLGNVPFFCGKQLFKACEFRESMVNNNKTEPCSKHFWKRKFDYDVTKNDWQLSFQVTQETRLRVLQWKLLHNIYPTNILLYKMKVTENNHCSYCNGIVDFIEHFFFYCPNVRTFWKNVQNFILAKYRTKLTLSVVDVIFGLQNHNELTHEIKQSVNHILLIGKMTISIFKKTKRHPFLFHLFETQLSIRANRF